MVMPFLRLVLIYIVVALVAVVFFNRDSVLPMIGWPWFGGSEVVTEEITSTDDDATTTETVDDKTYVSVSDADTETAAATASTVDASSDTTIVTPVASSDATVSEATTENTASMEEQSAEPVTQVEDAAATSVGSSETAPAQQTQSSASGVGGSEGGPKTDAELQTLQNEARQAYRNGDFAKTEEMYKSMAASNPDNVNIIGELGNLYYSQRRMSDAATYYHMAGKMLIDQGNANQAMSLMGVLQTIDQARAADLRAYGAANQ